MYPAPGLVERIGRDWDWIWLDGQHGQIAGYETMLSMVRACDLIERPAFVRVAGHDPGAIGLALDMGAHAVIVPQVDTPEQAQALIRAAKFPPLGNRSYGGRRPIDFHGRTYSDEANVRTRLICQIESPLALENAELIAALPGVDGLFLGPDDLSLRWASLMSDSGDKTRLTKAARQMAECCRNHDKLSFCVGVGEELTAVYASIGITHIVAGSDVGFLVNGSQSASRISHRAAAAVWQKEKQAGSPKEEAAVLY